MRLSGICGVSDATGVAPGVQSRPALKAWISTTSTVSSGRGSATSNLREIIYTARVLLNKPPWSRYLSQTCIISALVTVSSAAASVSSVIDLLSYSLVFFLPVQRTLREIVIARSNLSPVIASFFRKVFRLFQFLDDKTPPTSVKVVIRHCFQLLDERAQKCFDPLLEEHRVLSALHPESYNSRSH